MRTETKSRFLLAALAAGAVASGAADADASSPLEYPDNGSASFSRGGAWLALANEPIAAHYNPAALAIQPGGFSIEQQLNFNHVCYDRRGPDGQPEQFTIAPNTDRGTMQYQPSCGGRGGFPYTIPSISVAVRLTKKLGVGVAVVPPATYGTADSTWEPFHLAYFPANEAIGRNPYQQAPASYRYQQLEQHSTIIFPTIGIGYELLRNFRVGAAFVSGIAVINTTSAGVTTSALATDTELASPTSTVNMDHPADDSLSRLQTRDLFVPGVILSLHWSVTPKIDVALWGRYISDIHSQNGGLTVTTIPYSQSTVGDNPPYSTMKPVCRSDPCPTGTGIEVEYSDRTHKSPFGHFRLPYPPELRGGVRFHLPRSGMQSKGKGLALAGERGPSVDPLHDDVFDVELDGSYSFNESANTIEVRFKDNQGKGAITLNPTGFLPPNADRWNGYIDSVGVRLGGQYNVVQDKFAIRAGTWFETRSQEPEWLTIASVGGARGGFGGGIVLRQDFIDISFGYQRHWNMGLDNKGHGAMKAAQGTVQGHEFDLNDEPAGVSTTDRTQFRSLHTVNDGRVTQSAHAFTLGGTVRF